MDSQWQYGGVRYGFDRADNSRRRDSDIAIHRAHVDANHRLVQSRTTDGVVPLRL